MNSAQSVTATFALGPDFTLAPASSTLTVQTGAQTTDALTLAQQNGFSGQINVSCTVTGQAPLATCTVSPASVTVGPNAGNTTLSGTLIAVLVVLSGCGGSTTPPPPPKTFLVTVNAASAIGSLQHSTVVTLTVQ